MTLFSSILIYFLAFHYLGFKISPISIETETYNFLNFQKTKSIRAIKGKVFKVLSIGELGKNSAEFRFYDLKDITIAPDQRLFLLDSKNGSVIVLSAKTGEELFRFGRTGAGPGEFSRSTYHIRYILNRGIIIIDNKYRRATLFDVKGNVLDTYPLFFLTDDLVFVNNEHLLVSRYMLKPEFQPIHVISAKTGKNLQQFGSIVEPLNGLFNKVKSSPFVASDIEMYSYGWMTRIIFIEKIKRLFLIQRNPYTISYYNFQNDSSGIFIQAEVPFPTEKFIEHRFSLLYSGLTLCCILGMER